MSNVALRSFIQKIYKPIAAWIYANGATKTELGLNADEHLHPVNMALVTPLSTFGKNSVIGINGVFYRSTQATDNLPVTLVVENGSFVTETENGKVAYVVADSTINSGWEKFTDEFVAFWIERFNAILSQKQASISDIDSIRQNAAAAVKPTDVYSVNNIDYTVNDLLQTVANFMSKTLVVQG